MKGNFIVLFAISCCVLVTSITSVDVTCPTVPNNVEVVDKLKAFVHELDNKLKASGVRLERDVWNWNLNTLSNQINKAVSSANTAFASPAVLSEISRSLAISLGERNFIGFVQFLWRLNSIREEGKGWLDDCKIEKPFKITAEYLSSSKEWYAFLIELERDFSKQHNIDSSPIVAAVEEIIDQIGDNGQVKLTDTPIIEFVDSVRNNVYRGNVNITLDVDKLARFVSLFKHSGSKSTCSDGKLTLTGQIIRISEVNESQCEAKFIQVFALHKVIVDQDIDKTGKEVRLSIIAPKWRIQGSFKRFQLSGADGLPHDTVVKDLAGSDAAPGRTGKPGGPGGNFLGIGGTFAYTKEITVLLGGGKGGQGQSSGQGSSGPSGCGGNGGLGGKYFVFGMQQAHPFTVYKSTGSPGRDPDDHRFAFIDGNCENRATPKELNFEPRAVINAYKDYVKHSLTNNNSGSDLQRFVDDLENNENFLKSWGKSCSDYIYTIFKD